MKIPIISGIYTDSKADFRAAYPVNMKPIVEDTGINNGYLRPVEGITAKATVCPGISRGAITWNNEHFRVMGSSIIKIDSNNVLTNYGDVGDNGEHVSLAYSFDRLAIASNEYLFYLEPDGTLTQVVDVDLGTCLDVIWIDGYFMSTDGGYLVVTELADPTLVSTTKYGSSEIDPDPIVAIKKLRNEVYAINRYTIEVFKNIGGSGFPFGRITGAQIQRGALGTHCAVVYEENLAFLGSAPGESPGVFIGKNGNSIKISTRGIDEILASYSESGLALSVMEVVNDRSHPLLWIRLSDRTLVFDGQATRTVGEAVWYIMSSGLSIDNPATYRGIDVIWCYDAWQCGDLQSSRIGILRDDISSQFGTHVPWEINTAFIYNDSKGVVINSLELVALTGRADGTPIIETSYSLDGRLWSQRRPLEIGVLGNRLKRIVWRRQGSMRNMRTQKFTGDTRAYLAIARLEAEIEALTV